MADLVGLMKAEKKVLQKRLSSLESAIEALGGQVSKSSKKMSAATKAKLSKAAKARWAKVKKAVS
jgi:hypothetical protein